MLLRELRREEPIRYASTLHRADGEAERPVEAWAMRFSDLALPLQRPLSGRHFDYPHMAPAIPSGADVLLIAPLHLRDRLDDKPFEH
jgi:hypothetical protein